MNPAEGYTGRRRPDPERPTLRDLVLHDVALHPGAMSGEIALRISTPARSITAPDVSAALGKLRVAGRLRREGPVQAYQWALPGVSFALRTAPGRANAAAWAQANRARRQRVVEQLDALEALLQRRHPRHVSRVEAAVELRWKDATAVRRLAQLVEAGRARRVERHDRATGWYALPRPAEAVPPLEDCDSGAPGVGDCAGVEA